jgi:hypothetical protein
MTIGQEDPAFSPYRGLEPFDERDAAFFFGRERDSLLITASLFASRLTLLYGASGVGKSSVLRAGVLPRLRQEEGVLPVVFPGGQSELGDVVRGWQTDPLDELRFAVAVELSGSAGENRSYHNYYRAVVIHNEKAPLGEYLRACSKASGLRLMIILDQFEEYLLYHPEGDPFEEELPRAVVPEDLSVSFLISLREDSLAKLDRFKGRIPTLWNSYRRVEPLDRKAAEDAIRLPLKEYNRRRKGHRRIGIEDALVKAVLDEVQTGRVQFEEIAGGGVNAEPGGLGSIETPYLQLVMTRLWQREMEDHSARLRLSTLQGEGGAPEIVKTHLDRVMAQFKPEEQDVAAKVFHRLVTPSGAKIAFTVKDLAEYETVEPELLAPILRRLEEGSRRILRRVASAGGFTEEPRYEIFHDRIGTAILAWRAKRLKEQERERTQRAEAEQKRIEEQMRANLRETVDAAMEDIGADGRTVFVRMMFYLVTTDGKRLAQTASGLAKLSDQTPGAVESVLKRLTDAGIVRSAYGSERETHCEIVDDAVAASLLEWHSRYVEEQTREAGIRVFPHPLRLKSPVPAQGPTFPYRLVRDLFAKGAVVPFLGAGVSRSATGMALPSNQEFKEMLARECGFPPAELNASDIAEIASYYAQQMGREQLDELLQKTLGRGDCLPSDTHRFLAEAGKKQPMLILTTNYDTLMERALADAGAEFDIVAYLGGDPKRRELFAWVRNGESKPLFTRSNEFANLPPQRTVVFRVHGPLVQGEEVKGSYVLTEEDYIDWLNADVPRFSLGTARLGLLQGAFLLSLGQSARDWSQRALLRRFCEQSFWKARRSWAIALNPSQLSVVTWQRYDLEVHNLDLNEWAAGMRDAGPL